MALKQLSRDGIPAALEKAERYRLLNEPAESESICLDVLAIDPANERALVTMLLAQTDQFAGHDPDSYSRALDTAGRLGDEYDRAYYRAIISERQAKARLARGGYGGADDARGWLMEALALYERAEALRPAGNDDPILRWNACTRLLERLPAKVTDERPPAVTSE